MSIQKIGYLIITVVCLLMIGNFLSSVYNLWHKKDVLIISKKELQMEEGENISLKKELTKVKNPDFVEEVARDKLFLVKPGENIVIIPTITAQVIGAKTNLNKNKKANWEQWIELFFHS